MVKPMGMPVRQLTEADRELIPELLSMIRDLYPEAFAGCLKYTPGMNATAYTTSL